MKRNITENTYNELSASERLKLDKTYHEIEIIIEKSKSFLLTRLSGTLSFVYTVYPQKQYLTPFEKAQAYCFCAKYSNLPKLANIVIHKDDDKSYIQNIGELMRLISDYRPIVKNQKDSIFYTKIHNLCKKKMHDNSPEKGFTVEIKNQNIDITNKYISILDEKINAIKAIISNCEFGYLFDGILQHSVHDYTDRFWNDMKSGIINHIILKHSYLLNQICFYLRGHFDILNVLAPSILGPI